MQILQKQKIKKISTAYLFLVLLGIFGGHKFYLKKYSKGFSYIFTLGFLGIGPILDFITLSFQVKDFNTLVKLLNNDDRFLEDQSRFFKAVRSNGLVVCETGLLALKRNFCQDFEVLHISDLAGFSSSSITEYSVWSIITKIITLFIPRNRSTLNRVTRAGSRVASKADKRGILTLKFKDFSNPLFNLKFPTVAEAKDLFQILKNLKKSISSKMNIDEKHNEEKDEIDIEDVIDECMDEYSDE